MNHGSSFNWEKNGDCAVYKSHHLIHFFNLLYTHKINQRLRLHPVFPILKRIIYDVIEDKMK